MHCKMQVTENLLMLLGIIPVRVNYQQKFPYLEFCVTEISFFVKNKISFLGLCNIADEWKLGYTIECFIYIGSLNVTPT